MSSFFPYPNSFLLSIFYMNRDSWKNTTTMTTKHNWQIGSVRNKWVATTWSICESTSRRDWVWTMLIFLAWSAAQIHAVLHISELNALFSAPRNGKHHIPRAGLKYQGGHRNAACRCLSMVMSWSYDDAGINPSCCSEIQFHFQCSQSR